MIGTTISLYKNIEPFVVVYIRESCICSTFSCYILFVLILILLLNSGDLTLHDVNLYKSFLFLFFY